MPNWLTRMFGGSSGGSLSRGGGGKFAIDSQTAPIGRGIGDVITPNHRQKVKGIYHDGSLVNSVIDADLAFEEYHVADAKQADELSKVQLERAKKWEKHTLNASDRYVKINDIVWRTTAKVAENHYQQHAAHNRFYHRMNGVAASYSTEKDRMNGLAQKTQFKVDKFRQRLLDKQKVFA